MNKEQFKEQAKHGTALFPVSYYKLHLSELFSLVPLHWHEEMELTYIESGAAEYQIGLHQFTVKAGDLVMVNPHLLHRIQQIGNLEMISHSFVFHINLLRNSAIDTCGVQFFHPILNNIHHLPSQIDKNIACYPIVKECFLRLYGCNETKHFGYELMMKGYLFELLGLLYQHNLIEKNEDVRQSMLIMDKIKVVLNYIHENYNQSIAIKDLADLVHLSEYYFMRFFKKYTGMTCVEYINEYRLSKVSILLESTDFSITEVAMQVGFNNISYFNRLFKHRYGVSPKEYKKEMLSEKIT